MLLHGVMPPGHNPEMDFLENIKILRNFGWFLMLK